MLACKINSGRGVNSDLLPYLIVATKKVASSSNLIAILWHLKMPMNLLMNNVTSVCTHDQCI